MENKIIVRNPRVMEEYFHVLLEAGTDLFQRSEENIQEFIKKYEDYLFNANYDEFKDFAKKTGIIITRIYYRRKNDTLLFYMNELGIFTKYQNEYHILVEETPIFKNHLIVYVYVDDILIENDCIYEIKEETKKLIYRKNVHYDNCRYDGFSIRRILENSEFTLEEKVKLVKEKAPNTNLSKIEIKDLKQIECIYPYEDILILTNNGKLYVNDTLYACNVRELCSLTSYRTYIIYNNETIEFYTNAREFFGDSIPSKKTLCYKRFFIAWLNIKNQLEVEATGNETSSFGIDNVIYFYLMNIEDFTYTHDLVRKESCLLLTSNGTEIKFPLEIYVCK